ncbi:MAG: SLBB domain-containing protein [Lachnospiraceae bacterium]
MKAGVMILLLTGCTRRTEIHMDGLRKESFSETEQERQTEEQTGVSSVIYVYVCGAVQAPGVYALQDGMRVYEALAAAGGFREDADTQWLNQAAPVQGRAAAICIYAGRGTGTCSGCFADDRRRAGRGCGIRKGRPEYGLQRAAYDSAGDRRGTCGSDFGLSQ